MTPEQKTKIAEVAMALVTIAKDEYSRRRNMPKQTKSDEDEIDQLLELPKDVEIRCGLDNGMATVASFKGDRKIFQFRMNKATTKNVLDDLTKILSIMPDAAQSDAG
jgi:uncharacterized protein YjgD (DUF1641 family)